MIGVQEIEEAKAALLRERAAHDDTLLQLEIARKSLQQAQDLNAAMGKAIEQLRYDLVEIADAAEKLRPQIPAASIGLVGLAIYLYNQSNKGKKA